MKRFSASLLDPAGTRHVELRVRTRASRGSGPSVITIRSRVRTEATESTTVALHLRADALRSLPSGSVTAQLTPSLHEVSFTVAPTGEWSSSTIAVTRSRGDKRIVTHALLAGRAMTSTTVNRKVYVSVSTMAAMLLLLIGSIAVSRTANDTTVLAEPTPTTLPLSVDTTVESSTSVAPTTSTAQARAPFAALAARSEFPAMTDTTEAELLADIPNDGKNWLVVPRLHLRMQIVSGISDDRLALGVGWYRKSQKPGLLGNIGLAGHRTTFPAPFYFLDKMQTSDSVLLIVGDAMYRYAVKANSKNEPYDIVQPDNTRVLSYLGYNSVTLTTCTPIGTANQRLIVHAKLASRSPIDRKN